MHDSSRGCKTQQTRSQAPESTNRDGGDNNSCFPKSPGINSSQVSLLSPSDPLRQAKRLPIRLLKMLTAHTSHLLHPEYLQPLTSAPVSIELDAKKSPLALLAQTCSQIGKPDPPPPSKLSSMASGGLGEKDASGRSSGSGLKLSEHRQPLEDKSSFKPYSKAGGESRKDGLGSGGADKAGFRVPGGGGTAACPSFPPHAVSPRSRSTSPSQHPASQPRGSGSSPPAPQPPPTQVLHVDPKSAAADSASMDNGGASKKDGEPSKPGLDSAQLANSSHARASADSSSPGSEGSPHHDGKVDAAPAQPGLGSGHVAPVSPFKPGHSVFPLPPSSMGYHGSIVSAYTGYPSQLVPGLDHTKSSLVGGGVGIPGKHPSSSPLTGASPPSFMQGLCRDPYCLTYPNASHLGGSNCSSCVHDPSSTLKSSFPLVYPTHPLHALHPSSLSSSATPSLSHPLYTYGFMLPNEPLPHACNWVSAGGPCDKRFGSSEELLSHLRTHTALPGMDSKLLSAYPSASSSAAAAAAASCHLHLTPQGSPGSFSLRAPPGLGLARYHPYSKVHLPAAPSLPMPTLPAAAPYYSPYALYSQRLGSASALGYQ
ncbi:zinc finger protein 703-like [Paramormyrops kingsleyae]|uniref:Zinc finger protein 703 n=1 Tax=Paramormyrops kingsleyae TaxID=1676925 RepID=A0A3B3SVM6_9TELE|nr:zinc finger protein 703-like [Paramormyrops kingsleyae]